MTRRPRYRIAPGVLAMYLALAGAANMVVSALLTAGAVDDPNGLAGSLVFFPVYAAQWAATWWAGERWLPRERRSDSPRTVGPGRYAPHMSALTPAIGFTRAKTSTSHGRQRSLIGTLAANTDHEIVAWSENLGETLDLVKAGPARTVIAVDVARFSRNASEAIGWMRKVHEAGGRVLTPDGPLDPGSLGADVLLRLAAGLDEVDKVARKTAEAVYVRRSAAQGEPSMTAQQQAAEAWAAAEKLGYEVISVDGTRLDDEPPRP